MGEVFSKTLLLLLLCCQNSILSYSLKQCYDPSCCSLEKTLSLNSVVDQQCFTGSGHNYRGHLNFTNMGLPCINWMNTVVLDMPAGEKSLYGIGEHNFCRNPDPSGTNRPWCYVSPRNYGYCDVEPCLETSSDYKRKLSKILAYDETMCNQSDSLFSFNNSLYFVTNHRAQSYIKHYVIYKFGDESMTSFKETIEQTFQDAFNLCICPDDVITFVTSDSRNMTYLYMQHLNLLLRVDLSKKGWEVVDHVTFDSCLAPVLRSAMVNETHQAKIRSVFDFNNPQQLILLTRTHLLKCEWRNGILVLVFQEEFTSAEYLRSHLIFTNRENITYAITTNNQYAKNRKHNSKGKVPQNLKTMENKVMNDEEDKITSNSIFANGSSYIIDAEEAIITKPALAGLLLGYKILNNNTLVKLYDVSKRQWNKSRDLYCSHAGNKSRLMRIYNGVQAADLIKWLKHRLKINNRNKMEVDLKLHAAYIRDSKFCENVTNGCCYALPKQFEIIRSSEAFVKLLQRSSKISWINCRLHFDNATDCPELSCFDSNLGATQANNVFAACEIKLSPDPAKEDISLDEILGTNDERAIRFANAQDASEKIGRIADSLRSSNHPRKLGLGMLFSSIEALQPLNYDELHKTKTKVFISDFLSIVDNLADQERAKDWVNVKNNEVMEKSLNKSRQQDSSSLVARDPHSLLFITENVLERMASKDNMWRNSTGILVVETKNVISSVKLKYINGKASSDSLTDASLFNVTVTSSSALPDIPAVIVTSIFPDILQMISNVSKGLSSYKNQSLVGEFDLGADKESYPLPNSPVLSTSVIQNNTKLPSAIRFELPFAEASLPSPQEHDKKYYLSCSYLTSNNTWDTRGCQVTYSQSKNESIQCSCNHTTNFAIILQVIKPEIGDADLSVLTLISYIGETLSTFCLIVALTILGLFRQSLKSDRIIAHSNLIISLILFHLVQLFSYTAENWKDVSPAPCIVVAFASHFSLLSAFMWMLCEGITLHFSVVDVFNTNNNFKVIRYFIGWGLPLTISSSTLAYGLSVKPFPTCYLQGVGDYSCVTNNRKEPITQQAVDPDPDNQLIERCWLSVNNYLILALFVPAVIVLAMNTALMIRVSLLISKSSKATSRELRPSSEKNENNFKHFKKSLKGVAILMPILGVPWIFGVIPQALTHVAFLYAFTLLNSTQGVFLLLFYCILNNEVRNVIARCLRKRKLIFQQQTSVTQNTHCRTQSIDLRNKSDEDAEQNAPLFSHQRISMSTSTTCEVVEKFPINRNDALDDSGLFSSGEGFQSIPPTSI